MVNIELEYQGSLGCQLTHEPSGNIVLTDAPVDNGGKGAAFSPTDLVAGALGACMVTIMGKVAERKGLNLKGMKVSITKDMCANPRRIAEIGITINVPLPENHPDKDLLVNAALTCPVKQSLNPEVHIPITWNWIG